jgi:hypothetical protein
LAGAPHQRAKHLKRSRRQLDDAVTEFKPRLRLVEAEWAKPGLKWLCLAHPKISTKQLIPKRDRNETTSLQWAWTLPTMALNPHPIFPAAGAYVLKLHRDAQPQAGLVSGRIYHVASGESKDFASAEALLEWVTRHATQTRAGDVSAPQSS